MTSITMTGQEYLEWSDGFDAEWLEEYEAKFQEFSSIVVEWDDGQISRKYPIRADDGTLIGVENRVE